MEEELPLEASTMEQHKVLKNGLGSAGRVLAAAVLVIGSACVFAGAATAQNGGYIRVVTAQGALDGSSKDPAHMNWISISSVVAADLNGDAMADRESSAPSVSEVTKGKTATDDWSAHSKTAGGAGRGISSPTGASADRSVTSPHDASSGMATGRRMHKPFVIMKEVDKASPILMQACASGQHLKEVDVALASKPGGFYRLTDVIISSDQKSASSGGGDSPMESLSFTYQKIEWTH
jgi:hypothetical protein